MTHRASRVSIPNILTLLRTFGSVGESFGYLVLSLTGPWHGSSDSPRRGQGGGHEERPGVWRRSPKGSVGGDGVPSMRGRWLWQWLMVGSDTCWSKACAVR